MARNPLQMKTAIASGDGDANDRDSGAGTNKRRIEVRHPGAAERGYEPTRD
jgi:hypothetical protein